MKRRMRRRGFLQTGQGAPHHKPQASSKVQALSKTAGLRGKSWTPTLQSPLGAKEKEPEKIRTNWVYVANSDLL